MNSFVANSVIVANGQAETVGNVAIYDENYALNSGSSPKTVFRFGQKTGNPRTVAVRYSDDIKYSDVTSFTKTTFRPQLHRVEKFTASGSPVEGKLYGVHIYRPNTQSGMVKGKDFSLTASATSTFATLLTAIAAQINKDTNVFDYRAVAIGNTIYVFNALGTTTQFVMSLSGAWVDLTPTVAQAGGFGLASVENVSAVEREYKERLMGAAGHYLPKGFKDEVKLVAKEDYLQVSDNTVGSGTNGLTFTVAPILASTPEVGQAIYIEGTPYIVLAKTSPTVYVLSESTDTVVASSDVYAQAGYTGYTITSQSLYNSVTSQTVQNFSTTVYLNNSLDGVTPNSTAIDAFEVELETMLSRTV